MVAWRSTLVRYLSIHFSVTILLLFGVSVTLEPRSIAVWYVVVDNIDKVWFCLVSAKLQKVGA